MLPVAIMRMASGGTVKLLSDSVTSIMSHPSSATATYTVDNGGGVDGGDGGFYKWLGGGTPANYEINATLNSGTVTGTFGSWLNLGTSRSWSLTESIIGTKTGSITVQIRPTGGAVLATATISFHAEVD